MRKNDIVASLSRNVNKLGLTFKKYSPEFLLGAGIVGVVASAVVACKATTKVNDILEQSKKQVEDVHRVLEDPDVTEEMYSEEDSKKDLAIIYVQTGAKLAKLYAPAVALGALSIASILASSNIMHKRNVALAAAYTAVDNGFKEYRGRVIERFGESMDRELKYNIRREEIEEIEVDENGEEKTVKKTVDVVEDKPLIGSPYARFFDDGCTGWSKDAARNLKFLVAQQNYANEKLRAKGYLFLNDVYEMLGIPICPEGSMVGWVYDERYTSLSKVIDFNIFDITKRENRDFVNGYERTILLDFNIDGNVYKLMNRR